MLNTLTSYINDNYGSKRGLLVSSKFYCMYSLGYMRELKQVDFSRVARLVFVCSGNICRSPLGEHYAKHLGLKAESFGLHTRGGDPPDPRVVAVAARLGINVSGHTTRNIRDYRPLSSDLVIAMEPSQIEALRPMIAGPTQLTLAPLWLRRPRLYLHDPFGANENHFEKSAIKLMEALDNLKGRMDEHS